MVLLLRVECLLLVVLALVVVVVSRLESWLLTTCSWLVIRLSSLLEPSLSGSSSVCHLPSIALARSASSLLPKLLVASLEIVELRSSHSIEKLTEHSEHLNHVGLASSSKSKLVHESLSWVILLSNLVKSLPVIGLLQFLLSEVFSLVEVDIKLSSLERCLLRVIVSFLSIFSLREANESVSKRLLFSSSISLVSIHDSH
jgi:hypothetical protein